MANCFLLKDDSGRTLGFIHQRMGKITCRMNAAHEQTEIVTVDESGRQSTYTIKQENAEENWADSGGRIISAWIAKPGAMKTMPEKAGMQEVQRTSDAADTNMQATSLQATKDQEADDQEVKQENQDEHDDTSILRASFERRWPPPPCMSMRYLHGKWQAYP